MKKLFILTVAALTVLALTSSAQPQGKKWELGIAFDFSSTSTSESSESFEILTIPVRVGYYFWKGFEVEPEFFLFKVEDSDTGYQLNLNGLYNFRTSSSFRPFILAGLGINNGIKFGQVMEASSEVNGFIINAGAGLKYLVGNTAAFRLEYRYSRNRLKDDYGYVEKFNHHQFFMGVSIFF